MIIKADLDEVKDILPEEANIIIYRVTQEFLANVHKHSETLRKLQWPSKLCRKRSPSSWRTMGKVLTWKRSRAVPRNNGVWGWLPWKSG